ncbi:hypothetical protein BSKO_03255 [Bryopsis sp. KO-2023]|nr:hypothetical protein BSKO_03255 [Bryopsis sp. KO-2023]
MGSVSGGGRAHSELRPTTPRPFTFLTDSRCEQRPRPLTTEEIEELRAREEVLAFRRELYSPHRRSSSDFVGTKAWCPLSVTQTTRLKLRRRPLANKKTDHKMGKFHRPRSSRDSSLMSGDENSTPYSMRLTIPDEFDLATDKRHEYRAMVLEPQRRAKLEEKQKQEAEEARRHEEEEATALAVMRRALVHHARPAPSFANPFRPDLSRATPPTVPKNPHFATDERLGPRSTTPTNPSPRGPRSMDGGLMGRHGFAKSPRMSVGKSPRTPRIDWQNKSADYGLPHRPPSAPLGQV